MTRKVCTIVGAGEGLGQALAARFAREGFDIGLVSRSRENSELAIQAARSADASCEVQFYPGDATQPDSLERAIESVVASLGPIEILIYNARGQFKEMSPLEMTVCDLEDNYRIEVIGAFAAARAVMPAMIQRKSGNVFFSSATAAFRGSGKFPVYAIGKFGLRALSQCLAKAYSRDGVHIVHFRLDCDLDMPVMQDLYGDAYDPNHLARPEDVAESYWLTYLQPSGAWSNEVEIRPSHETWTY